MNVEPSQIDLDYDDSFMHVWYDSDSDRDDSDSKRKQTDCFSLLYVFPK